MEIKISQTPLKDVLIVDIDYFQDERGFLIEPWHKKHFSEAGLDIDFVQEVHSKSMYKVIRGLHYQDMDAPVTKLIRCISGGVFFVTVDLRIKSNTFGKWFAITLTADNKRQLFVPVGFAVGFAVLSDTAEILYKLTGYYTPKSEHVLLWNDKNINISWPYNNPQLSLRDKNGLSFARYKKQPSFI